LRGKRENERQVRISRGIYKGKIIEMRESKVKGNKNRETVSDIRERNDNGCKTKHVKNKLNSTAAKRRSE